jgi:hypothetical protein
MSKYVGFINNKAYSFSFKKHPSNKDWYTFSLGHCVLGQVYKKTYGRDSESRPTWGVIVRGDTAENLIPRNVEGFATRHYAVEYLLQTHELTRFQYNNGLKDLEIFDKHIFTFNKEQIRIFNKNLSNQPLTTEESKEIKRLLIIFNKIKQ